MVSGLMSRNSEERLIELGLTTLEERRHQADMLLMYKIVHGGENLPRDTWFRPRENAANTRQRADPLNVRANHGRLEIQRNFFRLEWESCGMRSRRTLSGPVPQRPSKAPIIQARDDLKLSLENHPAASRQVADPVPTARMTETECSLSGLHCGHGELVDK
jgi:hypothetical protein